MAKVIRLSDDNGVSWENLPGSEGAFNSEAEAIDDTVLGQTFQSNEVGLVGWSVSSNGVFKGFAGYVADVQKFGTPTGMVDETMALVTGKTYQVSDAAKEVWDRSTAVTFEDGVTPIADADIESVDYLFGRVTFVSTFTPAGTVSVTGNYLVRETIGRANTYNMTMNAESIDETTFALAQANSGTRVMRPGLRTVSLELGGIFDDNENAKADLAARNEVIIEVDPAGDGLAVARGFFKLATTGQSGAVGALEEETLNFNLTVPVADATNANNVDTPFNWAFDATTTLSQAIEFAITAWLTEINTTEVQYLPSGAPGQSPLDGIQGDCMFTDISLSGGLSNMNVFVMEMAGTGAFTEV